MSERWKTGRGWRVLQPREIIVLAGSGTIRLRSESELLVFSSEFEDFEDEVLAGLGLGQLELEFTGGVARFVRCESEGRVWRQVDEIDQRTEPVFGTVFTEVKPPSNVSPEMRRIQQLMRQNEMERRRQSAEWEARLRHATETAERAAKAALDAFSGGGGERGGGSVRLPSDRRVDTAEGGKRSAERAASVGPSGDGPDGGVSASRSPGSGKNGGAAGRKGDAGGVESVDPVDD